MLIYFYKILFLIIPFWIQKVFHSSCNSSRENIACDSIRANNWYNLRQNLATYFYHEIEATFLNKDCHKSRYKGCYNGCHMTCYVSCYNKSHDR